MKPEYLNCLKLGNSLIEIYNPSNGEIVSIISILEYNYDLSTKDLSVRGIDMTTFFKEQKFLGGSLESLNSNLMSFLDKGEVVVSKFSNHFPHIIYSSI